MFWLMSSKKWCLAAVFLFILVLALPAAKAFAQPDFMPVEQLKPGMKGIAKTVVAGTDIVEFGVEVLGVMKNKGPSGDLILVRTFGDVIDRTGGIAQGMSGSPVYIDGKLVGAVAYGWSLTDHKIGMVTPIADMLKLWEFSDERNKPSTAVPIIELEHEEDVEAAPLMTPLMVSGFTSNAIDVLKTKLKSYRLEPHAVGEAPEGVVFGALEPGSAVGVQLVRGDISVGALGTVTYTEGDKVLAFGHPFLKKGNIGYFMTNAYVFTTVQGLENSFKVGTVGDAVGIINQDRGAAVAGQTGRFPSVVPIQITVKDNGLKRTQEYNIQVTPDEQLSPILSAMTVFNAIEKTMDRVGAGTARVQFEISAAGMPGDNLIRENMFYSPVSIGEFAVGELYEVLSVLAGNQYNSVDIMDVKVSVTVDEEQKTASIIEAVPAVTTAKPGDKIDITVKLKPFRGEPISRVVPFTVPKDCKPGPLALEVRGGGMVPLMQLLLKQQGLDEELLKPDRKKKKSFEDVIKEINDRDRNNDIVIELLDLEDGLSNETNPKSPKKAMSNKVNDNDTGNVDRTPRTAKKSLLSNGKKSDEEGKKAKSRISTDYIIDRDTQTVITIVK